MIEKKCIEIYYSSIHVAEISHMKKEGREFVLDRARCIKELSRGCCFNFWLETQEKELDAVLGSDIVFNSISNRSDNWFPDLNDTFSDFDDIIVDEILHVIRRSSVNRRDRRRKENLIIKNKKLTDLAIQMIKSNASNLNEGLLKELPFREEFIKQNKLIQYIEGKLKKRGSSL